MKNIRIFGWVLIALIVLISASVWEGAAAVSISGDLPERGYYAATNSFPRNTIVDITNLETGRSVRVIVAAGLDTPGLLAILSRDAASDIGLQNRSIGRIRMTQPTDPIAFSRFNEGFGSSGDPDYDPQAFVNTNILPGGAVDPGMIPADPALPWEAGRVTNIPEAYEAQPLPYEEGGTGPDLAWVYQEPEIPPVNSPVDTPPVYPPESPGGGMTILEEPQGYRNPDAAEMAEVTDIQEPLVSPPPVPPKGPGTYDEMVLVPAESRPPSTLSYSGLPPEAEIAPLPDTASPAAVPQRQPDPALSAPPAALSQPVREILPPPPPVSSPAPSLSAPSRAAAQFFSVPLVTSLERGKYYLQLGAYSKAETVESEITRIGGAYPMVILNPGGAAQPVYRVLIGPVNPGESGALLQRFKGIGYTDAFVRSGEM
jgi:hypothetical protein